MVNKHDLAVYAAYIKNEDDLMLSSSGGIATDLAKYVVLHGGYVAGVAYTADFRGAEYVLTNSIEEIERLRGSKYIETRSNGIIAKIKNVIEENLVLFIGLPCMVATAKKIFESSNNLITCELVCQGPVNAKVQSDFIDYLEKKYGSKVIDFTVRYKDENWTPPYIKALFENGKEYKKNFYKTAYNYVFNILGRESCYACKFKGDNRVGDLMIGDFWGASTEDKFFNSRGVSVIFVETKQGQKLLQKIDSIVLYKTTFERAIEKNPMVVMSRIKSPKRDKLEVLLKENNLLDAVRKSLTFKEKARLIIKKIIEIVNF